LPLFNVKHKIVGGFSNALKKKIRERARGRVIHLCSGEWNFGITIDLITKADIKADVCYLPLRDNVADTLICDPPYDKEAARQYGYPMPSYRKILREAARITRPGGHIAFLSLITPQKPKGTVIEAIIGISCGPGARIRALMVFKKKNKHHKKTKHA